LSVCSIFQVFDAGNRSVDKPVLDILERIQGSRPEPGYVNFFTDASVLTSALKNPPTLILGPGEPSQAHQTNEYCVVEKIGRAVEFYLEIARNGFAS